ncbi:MAG TPA: Panacea domain-containing protein [Kofleriaceae bacterium]
MTKIEYSEERLVELALYIGAKCGLDEHYGVLKLNKILFYADFAAYRQLGKPITGAKYKKYEHGPAPAVMKRVRQKMEDQGDAFQYTNWLPVFSPDGDQHSENRLLTMREPKIEMFDPKEISIVDSVIERLRGLTGRAVSDMSHVHPGWKFAAMEDDIPYHAALLPESGPSPLSKADRAQAETIARAWQAS